MVLDAGSALHGGWVAMKSEGRVILEAMNAMGYDAMALGRMDVAIGLEALNERAGEATFPFLSANLVGKEDKRPLFEPYTILERQGAKIGIIGLSEPQAVQAPGVPDKATVLPPVETGIKYVAELRDQVDILIVLSHAGLEEDKALAVAAPGIDVIIGGLTRKLMRVPERVGNTLIVQQGYKGEWMGRLVATFDAQGVPGDVSEDVITLGPDYADDPEMVALVDKWNKLHPSPTPRPTRTPDPRTLTAAPAKKQ